MSFRTLGVSLPESFVAVCMCVRACDYVYINDNDSLDSRRLDFFLLLDLPVRRLVYISHLITCFFFVIG